MKSLLAAALIVVAGAIAPAYMQSPRFALIDEAVDWARHNPK